MKRHQLHNELELLKCAARLVGCSGDSTHHDGDDSIRLRLDQVADDFVVKILHRLPLYSTQPHSK